MNNTIHIYKEHEKPFYSLLLFLIPAIVFVSYIFLLNVTIDKTNQQAVRIEDKTAVLGDTTENIK
jgi:hypothetical protein